MSVFNFAAITIQVSEIIRINKLLNTIIRNYYLQKIFRGHLIRFYDDNSEDKINSYVKSNKKNKQRTKQGMLNKYISYLDYYRLNKIKKPTWLEEGYSSWCVVKLQSWFRMMFKHRWYQKSKYLIIINFIYFLLHKN